MVDVAKIGVKARVKSAMTYFQEKNAFYVLKIQFMYENAPRTFGRYQVFRFTFPREEELTRCVDSFKSFLGISKLADIKDQKVEMYVYNESGKVKLDDAELLVLNLDEQVKNIGILVVSEFLKSHTICRLFSHIKIKFWGAFLTEGSFLYT